MKPSTFKKGIEKEFDYICKQVIRDERKDYDRHLKRLSRKETNFSMIDDHRIKKISTIDLKPSHYYTFSINGLPVRIKNDLLAEALEQMTNRKREIILLYYFMELGTQQIADLLELNRSTIYRHRRDALEFIKNFMEGKRNEDLP